MTPDDFFVLVSKSRELRTHAQRALNRSNNPHHTQHQIIQARAHLWRAKQRLTHQSPTSPGFGQSMLDVKWATDRLNVLTRAVGKHRRPRRTVIDRLLRRSP